MRTGRTKDRKRREQEYKLHPETEELRYRPKTNTDDYSAQRGHEQLLHDEHKPPLDKIRPISPKNPRREQYLDTARQLARDKQ